MSALLGNALGVLLTLLLTLLALLPAPAHATSTSEASSECAASTVAENDGGSCTGVATGEYFATASACAEDATLKVRTLYRDDDLDGYTTAGVCCIYPAASWSLLNTDCDDTVHPDRRGVCDGFDNDCDGNIDCDDPACAACFVGQGLGCGGADSPCPGGGCTTSPDEPSPLERSPLVFALAVLVVRRRPDARSAGEGPGQ